MLCIPKHKKGKKMGTTTNFLKLRSTASTIKLNEWHNNFSAVKKFADEHNVPLIAVWSNGDNCGFCTTFEKAAMGTPFLNWQQTSQCAFWFGYCGDKSAEDKLRGKGFNWCYQNGKIKQYPFVRIYLEGKIDVTKSGADLTGRGTKPGNESQILVNNLTKILKDYKPSCEPAPDASVVPTTKYKVRFNEALTVKQINAVLDSIDNNKGYCPCQPKGTGTKCHCTDFKKNKGIGEPCICKIYVKQAK